MIDGVLEDITLGLEVNISVDIPVLMIAVPVTYLYSDESSQVQPAVCGLSVLLIYLY